MSSGRIPNKIADFGKYIIATNSYLQTAIVPTHGTRLGMALLSVAEWDTRTTAWIILKKIYDDPLKVTSDIRKQVKTFMKKFRAFAQPLLNVVAASPNATDTDGTVFHVVIVRKNPTHKENPITAACNALGEMLGGAKYRFKCRTLTDAKRSSLGEGADSVEIAFIIGDKDTKVPTADEIINRKTYTKATFILSLGTINSTKVLYIYFRWNNTKHPELAGPWCELQILPII